MQYQLLPFHFLEENNEFLLTNFVGDYLYLSAEEFSNYVSGSLKINSDLFYKLRANYFIASNNIDFDLDMLALRYKTKKAFVGEGVCLHMVVTTLRCNQCCVYCQASAQNDKVNSYDMTSEIACKVAEKIFSSKSKYIKIEFQGGEPTLNFSAIRNVVEKIELLNIGKEKNIEYVVCTNLLYLNPEQLDFYKKYDFEISTSIDGPAVFHDYNRIDHRNSGTYERVIKNIEIIHKHLGNKVDALLTISRNNLCHLREVIDEYIQLGFHGIVLRPLNPYGRCVENREKLDYSVDSYIEAYKEALRYILDLNKRGVKFKEGYTTLLLSRMLTPFSTGFVDLQSPCGASISGIIYNYNGKIYACDEGRMLSAMGDERFMMGTVDDCPQDIYNGKCAHELVKNSIVETIPQCTDCVYQMWCGADPVRNYATDGHLISLKAGSAFCRRHKLIFQELLKLLKSDLEDRRILYSWAWGEKE